MLVYLGSLQTARTSGKATPGTSQVQERYKPGISISCSSGPFSPLWYLILAGK